MTDEHGVARGRAEVLDLKMAARGHTHVWSHAVERQHERVMSSSTDIDQEVDALLYAVALRNLYRVAEMAEPFDPAGMTSAIAVFNDAVPDARKARNLVEHFDAYETRDPKRHLKHISTWSVWYESTSDGFRMHLPDDTLLALPAATTAARRLCAAIETALT